MAAISVPLPIQLQHRLLRIIDHQMMIMERRIAEKPEEEIPPASVNSLNRLISTYQKAASNHTPEGYSGMFKLVTEWTQKAQPHHIPVLADIVIGFMEDFGGQLEQGKHAQPQPGTAQPSGMPPVWRHTGAIPNIMQQPHSQWPSAQKARAASQPPVSDRPADSS